MTVVSLHSGVGQRAARYDAALQALMPGGTPLAYDQARALFKASGRRTGGARPGQARPERWLASMHPPPPSVRSAEHPSQSLYVNAHAWMVAGSAGTLRAL